MSYKSKPGARKQATQQELTKLEVLRLLKRIYRSLSGKGNLRAEKRVLQSQKEPHGLDYSEDHIVSTLELCINYWNKLTSSCWTDSCVALFLMI